MVAATHPLSAEGAQSVGARLCPAPLPRSVKNQSLTTQSTKDPNWVPIADLNAYCYSFLRILAPHTASGPQLRDDEFFDQHPEAYQQTPENIEANGGNVGRLDGSVNWK